MNTSQWDVVNVFVEAAGWDFIFGLNVLLCANGSWNSTDAKELLTYTTSKGYKVNWELGNGTDVCMVTRGRTFQLPALIQVILARPAAYF